MFVIFGMGAIFKDGPYQAFLKGGPKLGARVERHLTTGDKFSPDPGAQTTEWQ